MLEVQWTGTPFFLMGENYREALDRLARAKGLDYEGAKELSARLALFMVVAGAEGNPFRDCPIGTEVGTFLLDGETVKIHPRKKPCRAMYLGELEMEPGQFIPLILSPLFLTGIDPAVSYAHIRVTAKFDTGKNKSSLCIETRGPECF